MTDTNVETMPQKAAFAGAHRAAGYRESSPPKLQDEPMPEVPTAEPEAEVDAAHAPDSAAAAPIDLIRALDANPVAKTGWRGVLAKTGMPIGPSPKEAELNAGAERLRNDEQTIRQATWGRAVSILVANPKGGTGKTPMSLLLGGTLASVRGGSVAILEVADDPGALNYRAEGHPAIGVGELVRDVERIVSAGQLAGYTAPQTSFASVIGTVGRRPQLTAPDVISVARVLDAFYAIRVMDSGNQPSSSAFLGALSVTDALVVPILNAGDAVLEAVAMLEGLRSAGYGHLVDNATVLRLVDGRPERADLNERIDQLLEQTNVGTVHVVPYDAHIAERGELSLAKLAPATYHALAAAAASAVTTLQNPNQK